MYIDSKLWSINVVQSIENQHVTKRVQGGCKLLGKKFNCMLKTIEPV
jgi:hypothetical protein